MEKIGYCFVVAVGFLNVALNIWTKKAAVHGRDYWPSLSSPEFLTAFFLGLCSVACLLAVYVSKINLSRGILLMGATSIVGGALFGVLVRKERMAAAEWVLLSLIAIFYAYRMIRGILAGT